MRVRKQDEAGDFVFGSGSDFFVNEPSAVAQAVQTRLLLFSGEWFVDTSEGTPWNTQILGKYTSKAYDAVLKSRILGTPGVKQISKYSSSVDARARTLSVTATIDTIYGEAELAGVVVALPTGELYGGSELGGFGAGGFGGPSGV